MPTVSAAGRQRIERPRGYPAFGAVVYLRPLALPRTPCPACDHILHTHPPVRDSRSHRRRSRRATLPGERAVRLDEVVGVHKQGDHRCMVLQLSREGERLACVPLHQAPQRRVVPLRIAEPPGVGHRAHRGRNKVYSPCAEAAQDQRMLLSGKPIHGRQLGAVPRKGMVHKIRCHRRPKDPAQLANHVVKMATGQVPIDKVDVLGAARASAPPPSAPSPEAEDAQSEQGPTFSPRP